MFSTLLIANRGEIACRIIRTARRLGVRTVAVYSDADTGALHVREADLALRLGPAAPAESYLNVEAIVEAAGMAGADAVHPGYGFLAESAGFAAACAEAGLIFVGPPPEAIRAMGSKSEAKALMAGAGIPIVPGYHGAGQDDELLLEEARAIGFPVMIKAALGGGGKGMRIARDESGFLDAIAAARREARGAFGDDRLLLERFLARPRHIEMQVFRDGFGNAVHMFERDCSLQRRHQKVIEEAPAPRFAGRQEMGRAALAAAEAIDYRGAGTVEFIVEEERFYFMEMNTRLQVEHPVTEMITGEDLVEWQLRIASGEALPRRQEELGIDGHAFEARIYAEDPARGFLPASGRLVHVGLPTPGPHVRVDSGVREGDMIGIDYDPLIAKLVVWDRDRPGALGRLQRALEAVRIAGVTTNVAFLGALARAPAVVAGEADTDLIGRELEGLIERPAEIPWQVVGIACLVEMQHRRRDAEERARASGDPYSPWRLTNGWRLNSGTHSTLNFVCGEERLHADVAFGAAGYRVRVAERTFDLSGEVEEGEVTILLDGRRERAGVVRQGNDLHIFYGRHAYRIHLEDPFEHVQDEEAGGAGLAAPMPGRIVKVLAHAGASVGRGAPLVVMESMKMEHTINAPADGTVAVVHYGSGDLVQEGDILLEFESGEEA